MASIIDQFKASYHDKDQSSVFDTVSAEHWVNKKPTKSLGKTEYRKKELKHDYSYHAKTLSTLSTFEPARSQTQLSKINLNLTQQKMSYVRKTKIVGNTLDSDNDTSQWHFGERTLSAEPIIQQKGGYYNDAFMKKMQKKTRAEIDELSNRLSQVKIRGSIRGQTPEPNLTMYTTKRDFKSNQLNEPSKP